MISRFLLFLSVLFLGIGQMAWGQYTGTGTFTKITSVGELTDGYYVITNEADAFAMNNTHNGTFLAPTSISPSAETIINPSTNIVWRIESNGSGRTIYNEVIARYVSYSGSSNNIQIVENITTNNQRWNFTYSSSKWTVNNVATPVRQLSYNPQNPRFAAYGNANQHELQLYKMEASTDPTLTTNPASMSGFNYVLGSGPSSTQHLTLTGSNLEDDELVDLTVLDNYFEIATSAAGPYSVFIENIELSPTSNTTTIYVRLKAGLSVGNYEDEIGIESTLLDDPIYVPLSGVVNAPTPTTTLSVSSLSGFTYVYENGPSTSQNFTVEGSNLTSDITVSAPTNYQVSLSSGTGYQNALTLTPVSGTVNTTTIYVRLNAGLAPNNYNGNITVATAGIANKTVALTGSVTCGVITSFPFTETFEDSSPSRACWSQIQVDGTANWTYAAGSLGGNITTAQEGSLNARFVSQSGNLTPVTKLVSPVMDISGVTNPTVSFYYGQQIWASDQNELKVYYRTSSMNAWVEIAHYTGNISSWTEEQLALPNPSATYQIAFEGINDFGYANVLDNVRVHSMVACEAPVSQPTNLVFSGITSNSISVSFTAATADKYLVIRSTSATLSNNPVNGVVYTAGQTLGNGTIVQSSSATTFTANGLSPETEYFFFVFAFNDTDCGGGPAYNITSPLTDSETTLEGPCYVENFDSGTRPSGWIDSGNSGTITYSSFYADMSVTTGTITTAAFTNNPSSLKFDLARTTNPTAKTLLVQVSTSSQTSGFDTIATFDHSNTTSGGTTEINLDLSAYSSFPTVYIRFNKTSGSTSPWRIDNIEVLCSDSPNPAHTYFRSQTNGDWTNAATWESSEDGLSWAAATTYPGATAESVEIQAGHTVNINSSVITITNTTVYGTIEVTTDEAYSIVGDEEIELTIEDGGIFLVSSPGAFEIPNIESFGLVKTGGKIIAGPLMGEGSGTAFVNAYVGFDYGLFYFGDQAICEWANPSTTLGSSAPDDKNFFNPFDVGDIPIFRVTVTPAHLFGNDSYDNIFFSKLEIISPATFSTRQNGEKIFVGGMGGNGTFIQQSGGNIILGNDETVPVLEDSITLNVLDQGLRIVNGLDVPEASNVTIQSSAQNNRIVRENGSIVIDGQLNITNMRIINSSSGGIIVNNGGNLNTTHTEGIYGTNAAIQNGSLTLNSGSKIEYSALGNQVITTQLFGTSPNEYNYQNLLISGSGEKSPNDSHLIVNNITTVESGNLVIRETADEIMPNLFTSRKGITVAETGNLVLENNANLFQDADAVNSGDITVERFVQDMNNDMETQMDYVYWSSPVKEQSIQTFSPASQYKLWYNESNDYFYYIPSTEPNFIPAKGYAFSAENDKEDGYDETYQFIGTPQNDVITIPIKRSPDSVIDGITYKHGSNLVGNPYPSTIDAGLFHVLNQDKIDFHFEFWTNESYAPEQEGSGYSNNNYAILTGAGFTPPSENQETYDFENKNTIKVGQGFIVKKTEIGGPVDLVFDNSIRLPESGHFYHRNNLNNEKDRFWLTFISPNQMLNTALIGYFPNATDDFDRNFDALSPVSSDAIFTLLGEEKLGIQGLEYPLEITDEIPLGVKSHTQGVGSIYLRRAEGIFENAQTIYLRDKYEDLIHNLSEGPYEFELEEGETLDRFEIIFQEDEIMSTSDLLDNPIKIYHTEQNIVIESEKEKILSVEVYDLNGRKVHSKDRINSSLYQIRKTSLATQVFVVKVLTDGGKVETRKIINQ